MNSLLVIKMLLTYKTHFSRLYQNNVIQVFKVLVSNYSSHKSESNVNIESNQDLQIPTNPLNSLHTAALQKDNGAIYDKKPFKMICEKGKTYSWCLCGKSKTQPLCDGTHKSIYLKIKLKPVRFEVPTTKEYWLCNCKQTSNRPFCDGTHKQESIQQAIK